MTRALVAARERAAYFAAGFRAVFERDFLVLTSSGRFVAVRTSVIVLLACLPVAILWGQTGDPSATRAAIGAMGRRVFGIFVWGYPVVILLIGPALAAGALAGERALDTLTLVLAAPIRPAALVFAKFLARLLALLLPLVGGLPIAAIAFLYGGVSVSLFLDWATMCLALAVLAVAASLLGSAYARSVAAAVLAGYVLGVVVPASWSLLFGAVCPPGTLGPPLQWFAEHTPLAAIRLVGDAAAGTGAVKGSVAPFLVATAFGAMIALVLSAARLSRESQAEASAARGRGRVRRELFRNPVLDRAAAPVRLRRSLRGTLTFAVAGAATWLPVVWGWSRDTIVAGRFVSTGVAALVVLASASQALAAERQQGSLAVLLVTRYSAGDVVLAKLAGILLQGALLLLPGLALCCAAWWKDILPGASIGTWSAASAILVLLCTATGLRVSAGAPTAGRAAATAFGVTIGTVVAHGVLVATVALLSHRNDDLTPFLYASPPVTFAALATAPEDPTGERPWLIFWAAAHVALALGLLEWSRSTVEETDGGVG